VKIAFDNILMQLQPDALNWEPPQVIARDGNFAPVRGQFFSCRLSLSHAVVPLLYDWQQIFDTEVHLATLPHPYTGIMTDFCCYVDSVTPRMDTSDQASHCPVVVGVDITLSGIVLAAVTAYPFSFVGSFCPA
jgi:hypothetical protein